MRSATNALSHYIIIIYQTCGESERLRGERLTTAILASLVFPYRLDFPTDWISLTAQLVKSPSAVQETPVRSLGREDPVEKG